MQTLENFLSYSDQTPPKSKHTFITSGPDDDDIEKPLEEISQLRKTMIGAIIGIEYIDSRKRTSIRQISVTHADDEFIGGYCYLRKRYRTFRIDRIQCLFDTDGTVIELDEVFKSAQDNTNPQPIAEQILQTLRPNYITLMALARSDGHFHEKECEKIIRYLICEAEFNGIFATDDDVIQMEKHLARYYPRPEIVEECIDQLSILTERERKRFFMAAMDVINADERQDDAEFSFMIDLQSRIGI
jgi:uncharacterized membrane protein YebE (DUF533 family)